MADPKRQREIALVLCSNPELIHSPSEIAKTIGCSSIQAKLALFKLRERLGDHIEFNRLCPQCLTYSRFLGVCNTCGMEVDTDLECSVEDDVFNGSPDDHEIDNQVNEVYNKHYPIKLDVQTLAFLREERNPERRLHSYCLSRVANLLKSYAGLDPVASNQAALCTKKAVSEFLKSNKELIRIERSDKLAIITRALMLCLDRVPQYSNLWKDAINKLVTFPQVILYGEL